MKFYNNNIYDEKEVDNIILIGMTCSGKTTIGKYLSDKLNYKFIDTDLLIEKKEKMNITKIFNTKGEIYFREKERNILHEVFNVKKCVISTGGGMPIFFDNMNILKKIGVVIFLNTDINEIIKRASKVDDRPLLNNSEAEFEVDYINNINKKSEYVIPNEILIKNKEKEARILDMYEKRISIYKTANIIINVNNNMTVEELGNCILKEMNLFL